MAKGYPINPQYASSGFGNVTVNNGSSYSAFSSQPCNVLILYNRSGQTLQLRQVAVSGSTVPLADGETMVLGGIQNVNEIAVRRLDLSSTPVTLHYRYEL